MTNGGGRGEGGRPGRAICARTNYLRFSETWSNVLVCFIGRIPSTEDVFGEKVIEFETKY